MEQHINVLQCFNLNHDLKTGSVAISSLLPSFKSCSSSCMDWVRLCACVVTQMDLRGAVRSL